MKIGILGDIHEDLNNLKKAINQLEKKHCDEIICLGDMVGFCIHNEGFGVVRDANECVNIIRTNCKHAVIGNHDLHLVKKLPIYKSGINYPENWYDLSYVEKAKLYYGKIWLYDDELPSTINETNALYLKNLPEYHIIDSNNVRIMFSHYIYPDLSGCTTLFINQGTEVKDHFNFMKKHTCLIGISGHGHTEGFTQIYEKRLRVKPFGLHTLKNEVQFIMSPGIIHSNQLSGFMVFNTKTFELEVFQIN
jgi:predicted phosphodiesterase